MCLCLARYDTDYIINEEEFTEAIQRITNLIYANEKAASSGGLDPLAAQTKRVADYLIAAPDNQLLRKDLLIMGYLDYDTVVLDKIIDTLMEMGWVKRERVGIGKNSDWLFKLSGEPKNNLLRFRAQNNGRAR